MRTIFASLDGPDRFDFVLGILVLVGSVPMLALLGYWWIAIPFALLIAAGLWRKYLKLIPSDRNTFLRLAGQADRPISVRKTTRDAVMGVGRRRVARNRLVLISPREVGVHQVETSRRLTRFFRGTPETFVLSDSELAEFIDRNRVMRVKGKEQARDLTRLYFPHANS